MLFSIIASVAISIGELPSLVHSDCEVSTNIACLWRVKYKAVRWVVFY